MSVTHTFPFSSHFQHRNLSYVFNKTHVHLFLCNCPPPLLFSLQPVSGICQRQLCDFTYVGMVICEFDKIPSCSVHLLIRLITLLCFYDTITQLVFQGVNLINQGTKDLINSCVPCLKILKTTLEIT